MDIDSIKKTLNSEIQQINSSAALEELRVKYLGRRGIVAQLTSSIPALPPEERGQLGKKVNEFKHSILLLFSENKNSFLRCRAKKNGP